MIVCEYKFVLEDKDHKGYSMTEIDFYAWILAKFHEEHGNHRLTLWKNLTTGEYELIKVYLNQIIQSIRTETANGVMITNSPTSLSEIIFSSKDLGNVLDKAHDLWNKFHGSDDYEREKDIVCDHNYMLGSYCMKSYIENKQKTK